MSLPWTWSAGAGRFAARTAASSIRWSPGAPDLGPAIFLLLAAKARAILQGRYHATTGDIAAMALPVLRHRLIPSFNAEAAGQTPDQIIHRLVEETTRLQRGEGAAPPPSRPAPPLRPPLIKPGTLTSVKMRGV